VGSETILAVVACCSMLAAVLMMAFAYRLNEKWTDRESKWIEIAEEQLETLRSVNSCNEEQSEMLKNMGEAWMKLYNVMRREQNDRD
jgi:hypothetical protein